MTSIWYSLSMEAITYTVSALNQEVKRLLEGTYRSVLIEGEISNFVCPHSGHWYFTLKDEAAQIRAAMFRMHNRKMDFRPEEGMHVVVSAKVSLYPNRGDYQLIVDSMHEVGLGALQRKFDQLKEKLGKEGLFDDQFKQALPSHPQTIGVVTSATGAAIQDVLSVLARRYPVANVIVYPTLVQGNQAKEAIVRMIDLAEKRRECDVLIITRGGGSLEDLWAFNEEVVARALFRCDIPIITGIGHEIDYTIADFVADVRAPTPSAAAECATPNLAALAVLLQKYLYQLAKPFQRQLQQTHIACQQLSKRLERCHPERQLENKQQLLDQLQENLNQAILGKLADLEHHLQLGMQKLKQHSPEKHLTRVQHHCQLSLQQLQQAMINKQQARQHQLKLIMQSLHLLSPLATLDRGYCIATDSDGHVITKEKQVRTGQTLQLQLAKGILFAQKCEQPTK